MLHIIIIITIIMCNIYLYMSNNKNYIKNLNLHLSLIKRIQKKCKEKEFSIFLIISINFKNKKFKIYFYKK